MKTDISNVRQLMFASALVLLASAMRAPAEPVLADPANFRLQLLAGNITNGVGLAADASGNLYVGYHDPADSGGSAPLRKVTPAGVISDFGAPIPDPDLAVVDFNGDLTEPGSVLVGGVLPGGLRHLTAVSPDGLTTTQLFAVANQPAYPNVSSLAFDSQGRLLVVGGTNVLGAVTNDLIPFVAHTFGAATNPVYVTTSPDGRIFTSFRNASATYSITEVIDGGMITSDQPLVGGTGGFLTFSPTAFGDAAKPLFAQSATEVRRVDTNSGAVATFATGIEGVYPGLAFTPDGCLNILTGPGQQLWRVCECAPGTMDLAVSKTAPTNTVATGGNLTYTVTVRKYCSLDATGVTVTDALPPEMEYVSADSTQGACMLVGSDVVCNIGTLTNGQSATVTITVLAADAGSATNTVSVSANETDASPANDTAQVITTILEGPPTEVHDLALIKMKAPKNINLSAATPALTKRVVVQIQNRSAHVESISNFTGLVTVQLHSYSNACVGLEPVATLIVGPPNNPKTLKPKQKMNIFFEVEFTTNCIPNTAKGLGNEDYRYVATISHFALTSIADTHTNDDVCPRLPQGIDPNPDGKLVDKGCGNKDKLTGQLGADVKTDVFIKQ